MADQSPEEAMRAYLMGESWQLPYGRKILRRLPAEPHCKLCAAPSGGIGGAIPARTILSHDGLVDTFVGDEVIGLFLQGISGPGHAAVAVATARDLLERVGAPEASPSGPIPVGAAVHTGPAYVGSTGSDGRVTDFTALGDVVNTTARLASSAATGELLVSVDAADAAGLDADELERRRLEARGRSEPIEVLAWKASVARARS